MINLCDFCSEYSVFSVVDEYRYKDKEGYLRARKLPYIKRACREHEKLIEKKIYYAEDLEWQKTSK